MTTTEEQQAAQIDLIVQMLGNLDQRIQRMEKFMSAKSQVEVPQPVGSPAPIGTSGLMDFQKVAEAQQAAANEICENSRKFYQQATELMVDVIKNHQDQLRQPGQAVGG